MLMNSLTSLELVKSEDYVTQAFDDAGLRQVTSRNSSKMLKLTRNATHTSEINRIILGIRDDRDLDAEQYRSYGNYMEPEVLITKQLNSMPDEEGGSENSNTEKAAVTNDDGDNDDDHPVDGPFAFWQAFLVMLMVFLTWGANAAFGVFLNYYLTSNAFPGASKYDFALMGGVVVCLAQLLAPFTTLGVRIFGQTQVHLVGICIQTLGYFLAAECKKLWQIFLCQGILVGLSFSLIFIPGTLVIPTWFDKSKALAMGIAVSGAGLGGLIFSLMLNAIIQKTGDHRWALRTVGFVDLAISLFGTVFLRARNKQKVSYNTTLHSGFIKSTAKVVFNFKIFWDYPLMITGIWFGIVLLGYVIILYSFAAVATSVGLSHTQSSNILAVLNASQTIGRPTIGNLGDRLGRNNTAVLICLCIGVLLTAFWLHATNYTTNMVLAALVGFIVGIGSLMSQSLAYDVLVFKGIPEKIPAAWGGLNIIVGMFSLPSEVIALKLQKGTGPRSYRNAQIFTGCCFFFGALLMLVNREWLIRQTFKQRRKQAEESLGTLTSEAGFQLGSKADSHEVPQCELEVTLRERVDRYNRYLGPSPLYFLLRMFYPIRV